MLTLLSSWLSFKKNLVNISYWMVQDKSFEKGKQRSWNKYAETLQYVSQNISFNDDEEYYVFILDT